MLCHTELFLITVIVISGKSQGSSMSGMKLWLLVPALLLAIAFAQPLMAQEAKPNEVYLDEPAAEPPARESRRQKVDAKYDNGQVRFERNVVILSDDSFMNDGAYLEYYPDGQKFCEGQYEKGVMVGEWKYWHPSGQICKTIDFKVGKPEGKVEVFRADGTLESVQSFKAGKRDGEWVTYYDDGKTPKVKVTIVDGKVNGERITYHANGQIRQQMNFVDGQLDGQMAEFDETGKKLAQATWKAGKQQGKTERFDIAQ